MLTIGDLIVILLLAHNFIWFVYITLRINGLETEIKKGNKDQQEIKTRLTYIKKRQYDMQTAVKRTLLRALEKSIIVPNKTDAKKKK